jgi:hypothetical protein
MGGTSTTYLTVNANNGNVGIGTTSPAHKLDVVGSGNFSPVTPSIAGSVTDADMVSSGYAYVQGKYCYVTSDESSTEGSGSFAVIDVSDQSDPVLIGKIVSATLYGAEGLWVVGRYAYVACLYTDTFVVIDVSDPRTPSIKATLNDPTYLNGCENLEVCGNYAYVTCMNDASDSQFTVIDIANPLAPVVYGTLSHPTLRGAEPAGAAFMDIQNGFAYVTCRAQYAVVMVDISDPADPTVAAGGNGYYQNETYLAGATGIEVRGRYAYVAGKSNNYFVVLDVSNPAAISLVGTPLTEGMSDPSNVHLAGNYAYITSYTAGFGITIIDVSDPASPAFVTTMAAPSGSQFDHLHICGRYGYQTDTSSGGGLYIVDLGGVETPNVNGGRGHFDDLDVARDVAIAGNLYVGGGISAPSAGVSGQVDFTSLLTPGTPRGPCGPRASMFSLTIALAAGASIDIRSGPDPASLTSVISSGTGIPVDSGPSYPPWVLWTFTWWQLPGTWFVVNLTEPPSPPDPWYIVRRIMEWY